MTRLILTYLAVINIAAFYAFGVDKHRARKNRDRKKNKLPRIPEKNLMLLALAGGSIGAFLGMQVFRHKTQHRKFVFGVPAILVVQVCLCLWLAMTFSE